MNKTLAKWLCWYADKVERYCLVFPIEGLGSLRKCKTSVEVEGYVDLHNLWSLTFFLVISPLIWTLGLFSRVWGVFFLFLGFFTSLIYERWTKYGNKIFKAPIHIFSSIHGFFSAKIY